jgi:hypothetical protein
MHGEFKGDADLDGETKRGEGAGVRGLESVGSAEPHLVVGAVGCARDRKFTLSDGLVAHVLSVINATEKLMGECVAGLRGDEVVETGGGFIYAALLQKRVGLGRVGQERGSGEEEQEKRRETDADRMCRDEHG